MFILGAFGVSVKGRRAEICELPEKISFGDLTRQGFPFYSGAVTYKTMLPAKDSALTVCASKYAGALVSVDIDNKPAGKIIYPPYTLTAHDLEDGMHEVDFTLFIHRFNSFGPVHFSDETDHWQGPGAWRSDGRRWSYEYQLKRTGILRAVTYK